jgi:hypothetical protein
MDCDVGGAHFLFIDLFERRNESASVPSSSRGGLPVAWRQMLADPALFFYARPVLHLVVVALHYLFPLRQPPFLPVGNTLPRFLSFSLSLHLLVQYFQEHSLRVAHSNHPLLFSLRHRIH